MREVIGAISWGVLFLAFLVGYIWALMEVSSRAGLNKDQPEKKAESPGGWVILFILLLLAPFIFGAAWSVA